jgi:colicin import membrane protein
MSAAALPHDHFMPQPLPGRGTGVVLALLAHGLLVLALALGVSWHTSVPTVVQAELWAEVPRAAAPALAEPALTEAPQAVVNPPAPRQPPPPSPQEIEDAQIATEKIKRAKVREEARVQREIEEKKVLEQKRAKDEAEKLAKKLAAERKAQEEFKEQQEKERIAAARQAQLRRIQGLAGSSGAPTASGDAAQASGPSADYLSRVAAQIKPRINNPSVSGNPSVVFEIFLASDGRILGQRLISPSGVRAWDDAVERGIIDTKVLPRLPSGSAPKSIILSVRPGD